MKKKTESKKLFLDGIPKATRKQGKAMAETLSVAEIEARLDQEIKAAMSVTWFDWMTYMDTTYGKHEGWVILKDALIAKPKLLSKKSEPGCIAGYTPRQLQFFVKTHCTNTPNAHHLPDLLKKINSK